jgi:hypothetical protein
MLLSLFARMRSAVNNCYMVAVSFLVTVLLASAPMYGTSAFVGQNTFYRVDLATGAGVPVGPNPSYTAFDFAPNTTNLFGAVPIGDGFNYSIAALFPSTNSYTLVGPTFDMGGQVPSEMTFDAGANVFVVDPIGGIKKIDLTNSTVTTIRNRLAGPCFVTQFSCDGIAYLNGKLIQVGLSHNNIRYFTIDPLTGGLLSFKDGVFPELADHKGAWLDAVGGTLYLGVEDESGRLGFRQSISWGTADPATGVFTKLSDNQVSGPGGGVALVGGLAVEETTTPEPSSLGFAGLGIALLFVARLNQRSRGESHG